MGFFVKTNVIMIYGFAIGNGSNKMSDDVFLNKITFFLHS